MGENSLKQYRESRLISKTKLAREAKVCMNTISRIENGCSYRNETKLKILEALGLKISDQYRIFGD